VRQRSPLELGDALLHDGVRAVFPFQVHRSGRAAGRPGQHHAGAGAASSLVAVTLTVAPGPAQLSGAAAEVRQHPGHRFREAVEAPLLGVAAAIRSAPLTRSNMAGPSPSATW